MNDTISIENLSRIYREIWTEARKELGTRKKLVIGGYSFPPTDFHVRRLFREAFAKGRPDELIIINPNTEVVGRLTILLSRFMQ